MVVEPEHGEMLAQPRDISLDNGLLHHVTRREGGQDFRAAELVVGGVGDEDIVDGFAIEQRLPEIAEGRSGARSTLAIACIFRPAFCRRCRIACRGN